MSGLRIAYLLEDTTLTGGARVVVAQADALIARGHHVTIVAKGKAVAWRTSRAEWRRVSDFRDADLSGFDFVVATFWTTVPVAWELAGERAVHLCQGYEGAFSAYAAIKGDIDAAYSLPIPKLTVSPHLVEICKRFHGDAESVGQIVDAEFYRDTPPEPEDALRVILCGPAQGDMKGITEGYAAAAHARNAGGRFQLVRVSVWEPIAEEPTDAEFHVAISTPEMTKLMHSVDVLLAPNHAEEGFGLPAAEAMASSIPTVLTAIPSYLAMAEDREFALFAPERDPAALGDALLRLLSDAQLRATIGKRGRQVAEQFRAERTGERLDRWFSARARTRRSGR